MQRYPDPHVPPSPSSTASLPPTFISPFRPRSSSVAPLPPIPTITNINSGNSSSSNSSGGSNDQSHLLVIPNNFYNHNNNQYNLPLYHNPNAQKKTNSDEKVQKNNFLGNDYTSSSETISTSTIPAHIREYYAGPCTSPIPLQIHKYSFHNHSQIHFIAIIISLHFHCIH